MPDETRVLATNRAGRRTHGALTEVDSAVASIKTSDITAFTTRPCAAAEVRDSGVAELLRHELPLLAKYLGDIRFDAMSRLYGLTHPSALTDSCRCSNKVARFLATTLPFSRKPEIAELASLECALSEACGATEAGHLETFDFLELAAPELDCTAMAIHDSARLLKVKTNVASLWSSLKAGEKPPSPINLDWPQYILVWRQKRGSRFRLLGEEEAMIFAAARDGAPFGTICDLISNDDDLEIAGFRLAAYLRGWIESELIVAWRRAEAAIEK